MLVRDGKIRGEFDVIAFFESNNVVEEVALGHGEILDVKVKCIIGVFNAGDGDVADLVNERGYDDFPDITPQIGLELQASLAIAQQILGEPSPVLPEALISQIFAHSLEPIPDR